MPENSGRMKSCFYSFLTVIGIFALYIIVREFGWFVLEWFHIPMENLIYTVLLDVVFSVVFAFFYWKYVKRPSPSKVFKPMPWFWFFFVSLVIIMWYFSQFLACYVVKNVHDPNYGNYANIVESNPQLYAFVAIILAPLSEELLFRGLFYSILKKSFSPVAAGLMAACLFAVSHLTLVHLPVAFTFGFFLAFIYEFTGCLRYSVLAHMFSNLLSFGILVPVPDFVVNVWTFWFIFAVLVVLVLVAWKYKDQIYSYVMTPHLIDKWNEKEMK